MTEAGTFTRETSWARMDTGDSLMSRGRQHRAPVAWLCSLATGEDQVHHFVVMAQPGGALVGRVDYQGDPPRWLCQCCCSGASHLHAGSLPEGDYWLLDLQPERVPVAIVVGSRDRFYPVRDVETTREVLQQKGFEVVVNVIEGHDHNYYRRSGEINEWVWAFLEDKVLPHDPICQEYTFPGR